MNSRIRKALPFLVILFGLLAVPAVAQAAQHITWKTDNRLEAVQLDGFAGVSCPSQSLCVAVDEDGRVVYTTKPKTNSTKVWHFTRVEKLGALTGVSCATTTLCVAIDGSGKVLHSTNPTGGTSAWSSPIQVDNTKLAGGTNAGLSGIACPGIHLCVAVDNSTTGGVLYTTDPTGPASDWHRSSLGTKTILDAVTCPSTSECAVAGTRVYISMKPSSGKWKIGGVPANGFLNSIACPSVTICVAAGYDATNQGLILASKTVRSGTPGEWHRTNLIPDPPKSSEGMVDSVACANTGFCIALDTNDNAFTSLHPAQFTWDTTPDPIRKNVVAQRSLISCHGDMCVAMDSRGVERTGIVSS
jgi:hypothetical protein